MGARHAVLLTSAESAHPDCLQSCWPIGPITHSDATLTTHAQIAENTATLSFAESTHTSFSPATSLDATLMKNSGGARPSHFGTPHLFATSLPLRLDAAKLSGENHLGAFHV